MANKFEYINNKVFETCNYSIDTAQRFIEQFEDFIQQIEEKNTIEEYGEITNTEKLIELIKDMKKLDTSELKKLAYRINFLDRNYTFEIKNSILDRVQVIEFNNFGDVYTFESIKSELLDMIQDMAINYGIDLSEEESL